MVKKLYLLARLQIPSCLLWCTQQLCRFSSHLCSRDFAFLVFFPHYFLSWHQHCFPWWGFDPVLEFKKKQTCSLRCLLLIPAYSPYHILLLIACYAGAWKRKILSVKAWFPCLHEHILSLCSPGALCCPSRCSCSCRFEHQEEPPSLVS